MKSYKQIVTVTTLSFALLVCMQVVSQARQVPSEPAQAAQSATAQGELVEVDAKANTLSIKTTSADLKFTYNEQTKVTGAQKGVAGLATMAGSQVTVQYHKEGAANIATSIEVRAAQAPRP
jgi:phosphoenolpyruvate-protein kinase (PTS system EI component)